MYIKDVSLKSISLAMHKILFVLFLLGIFHLLKSLLETPLVNIL